MGGIREWLLGLQLHRSCIFIERTDAYAYFVGDCKTVMRQRRNHGVTGGSCSAATQIDPERNVTRGNVAKIIRGGRVLMAFPAVFILTKSSSAAQLHPKGHSQLHINHGHADICVI